MSKLEPIPDLPPSSELVKEIEQDLYDALEGLENGDLITVRQCAARVHSSTIAAWKQQRREGQMV